MNKHVESLPKVDKFITFHYCTLICDVLRPMNAILLKRQHKLYQIFLHFKSFLKVDKFVTFSERPKAKSVSASGGLGALPLDPAGGSAPRPPYYRGLTLVFGGPPTV